MIVVKIETFPLRIPLKRGSRADAAAWGDKDLPAADSLLVKATTNQWLDGWGEAFGFRAVSSARLAIDAAGHSALRRPARNANFAFHARNPEKAAHLRPEWAFDLWPFRGDHRRMVVIISTNNPVRLTFLIPLLKDSGFQPVLYDSNMAAVEGSIGAVMRRIAVNDQQAEAARQYLSAAGEL